MTEQIRGEVKFYPYRTARVGDVFLELPREGMRELEEKLAAAAGERSRDNHTVYAITQISYGPQRSETTYLWFSDLAVMFGRTLIEGRW